MTPGPAACYHTVGGHPVTVHPIQPGPVGYQTHCHCQACGTDVPMRGPRTANLLRSAKRWAHTHTHTCPNRENQP